MKIRALCLLAPLFLTACAGSKVYRDGVVILHTQADVTNVTIRDRGFYFHADQLNHSRPTIAGGSSAAKVLGGGASLATAVGAAVATRGVLPR